MGGKRIGSIFLWYLVCVVVISAEAADDVKNLNIWPMPKSVSYGYGNLHLSNEFELRTDGSKFVDASGILKDAFLRSLDVIKSTHVIELHTSKIDPSLLQHGIDESYKLHVPAQGRPLYAHIEAQTVYGALHGLETFSQVCHYNISSRGIVVHQVPWTVADQPRFSYRGLLIGIISLCQ